MKAVDYYEGAFGVIKLTGVSEYLLPLHKPDYMKERTKYLLWKRRDEERKAFEDKLSDFGEHIWKLGGNLREIVVS
jgi:hypothetical protein